MLFTGECHHKECYAHQTVQFVGETQTIEHFALQNSQQFVSNAKQSDSAKYSDKPGENCQFRFGHNTNSVPET